MAKKRDRNRHGCGDTYHGRSKSNCLTNCNYFCSHCIHFKNFSMPSVFRIDGSFAHLQGRHLSFAQAQAKNRALCTVAIIYALRSAVVPKWIRLSRIFSYSGSYCTDIYSNITYNTVVYTIVYRRWWNFWFSITLYIIIGKLSGVAWNHVELESVWDVNKRKLIRR